MDINLKDENVVKKIVADLLGNEDRDRKRHSFESWECYSGNLGNYVKKELVKNHRSDIIIAMKIKRS